MGSKSDWIGLRSAENVTMKKGDFKLVSLGVAMELPESYGAHVVPGSSTFKNFDVIQVNSVGIIDNSYCGDRHVWDCQLLLSGIQKSMLMTGFVSSVQPGTSLLLFLLKLIFLKVKTGWFWKHRKVLVLYGQGSGGRVYPDEGMIL